MAMKLFPFPFPIFLSPPDTHPNSNSNPFEVRLSKWNNANAEKFNEPRRIQGEIEDDIRRTHRVNSGTPQTTKYTSFKPKGRPSSPSRSSIPGKWSKYSKPERDAHPAFVRPRQMTRQPQPELQSLPADSFDRKASVTVGEDGASYIINGAPFEFKYSYTETPKVKPIKLREPPYSPFGPATTPRPWTGRAPLPASRKKLKEFDSFQLPPPHKKGVKPVQAPGPYLLGTAPRYVSTREEILGEPLTKEEVEELVSGCLKTKRQLNMGRDGFTHNMLDNIHAHWKRKRVCKIKCKGVCTVDMNNVCQELEERTGGKIIYRKGGLILLFRGRNYNYRTRPRFPLMLWKPVSPVYPKLVRQVPEGLTLEEVAAMRKKGRELIPICKLGKNGVYENLASHVREAFEVCELVRINCQGMNTSDYRKIGAKLRDLVPCVLISFEHEHILMWRGKDWKSSILKPMSGAEEAKESAIDSAIALTPQEERNIDILSVKDASVDETDMSKYQMVSGEQKQDLQSLETDKPFVSVDGSSIPNMICESKITSEADNPATSAITQSRDIENDSGTEAIASTTNEIPATTLAGPDFMLRSAPSTEKPQGVAESSPAESKAPYVEEVLNLLNQAVESGSAVILSNDSLDADIVYQRAVTLARSAPPGPIFMHRHRKAQVKKSNMEESTEPNVEYVNEAISRKDNNSEKKKHKLRTTKRLGEPLLDAVPQGSLGVDELAKLLA